MIYFSRKRNEGKRNNEDKINKIKTTQFCTNFVLYLLKTAALKNFVSFSLRVFFQLVVLVCDYSSGATEPGVCDEYNKYKRTFSSGVKRIKQVELFSANQQLCAHTRHTSDWLTSGHCLKSQQYNIIINNY